MIINFLDFSEIPRIRANAIKLAQNLLLVKILV